MGFLLTILFWLLYPYQVSTVKEPIRILNEGKTVAIGTPIVQELVISKPNDEAPIETSRTIICSDGNLVTLSVLPGINLPIGDYTLVNDRYILPPKVAVGTSCQFIWRQAYQVNPVRTISAEWRSEWFIIKAKEN